MSFRVLYIIVGSEVPSGGSAGGKPERTNGAYKVA